MKHSFQISLIMAFLFLAAQIIGLYTVNSDLKGVSNIEGEKKALRESTNLPEPPSPQEKSYWYILLGVLIGTVIFSMIVKFKKVMLWKVWFFLAVFMCLRYSLGVFIGFNTALVVALVAAFFRVFRRHFVFNNIVEIFVYGGLAVIFLEWLNIRTAIILLLIVSVYDIFAVRISKHMIKLAKFQIKEKVFAGMMIPYKKVSSGAIAKGKIIKVRNAILGGGDICFPLLFSSVAMNNLFLNGMDKIAAFYYSMIISVCAAAALFLLFCFGKDKRFYPAMPFLTAGCLVGYLLVRLIA